jgi:hypothetical protein
MRSFRPQLPFRYGSGELIEIVGVKLASLDFLQPVVERINAERERHPARKQNAQVMRMTLLNIMTSVAGEIKLVLWTG